MKKILTLTVIKKDGKVLLGMKKRGFGQGKWNGFGGKLHEGEAVEDAVIREAKEEAGITVLNMEKIGILEFDYTDREEIMVTNIFNILDFSGEPSESEEMLPKWFEESDLPYGNMWPDDKFWLPLALSGKKFVGKFLFDADNNITNHEIEEVENPDGTQL